ncbi:class F sortase [Actinomadura craniellae]|uniref:class F sortase n=1 Tax=Actinomadura craniellae TaxID=2231787 RepID=UPI001F329A23|nr:class F sortase [Actinomadura craniellae]
MGPALAAVLGLALTGAACADPAPAARPAGEPPARSAAPATSAPSQAPSPARSRAPAADAQVPDPVRVRIPAIRVSAPVVPLPLDRNGTLVAPKGFTETGWNQAGPEPGEQGTAVIAGHVDSHSGPAVFYRLRELRAGDRILVDHRGGTVEFTVRRLARHPKNRIPNEAVYGATGNAELRLITCGGSFDRSRRSYRDNIIVFARAT